MKKVISQSSAIASAVQKVNGSAAAIVTAAVNADKARGKLAEQVRALFASPVPVITTTLQSVFTQLAEQLTKKEQIDAEAWARIANSIATQVRQVWNAIPESDRPQVCYIALNRGACTATIVIMEKPTKAELKAALQHDVKALNAAEQRLFPKKPSKPSKPSKPISVTDKNDPAADAIGAFMEQLAPLSTADLHELAKRIAAEIDRRTAANLEKAEKKGRGASASGKQNAKSQGESQRQVKGRAQPKQKASIAPIDPVTPAATVSEKSGAAPKGRTEAAPTFKPTDAEAA